MAKSGRTRKGLPIKKMAVTRLTKGGKFSSYTQAYHTNPFKKEKKGDDAAPSVALNKAELMADKMKTRPSIDKRSSMAAMVQTLTPSDNIGLVKTNKLCSKLKTLQDVKELTSNFLDNSFKKLQFITTDKDITRINEHSKILNNIPPTKEAYEVAVGSLVRNKKFMAPEAFSSLIYSFSDHKLLEQSLSNNIKSEAYTIDELKHD